MPNVRKNQTTNNVDEATRKGVREAANQMQDAAQVSVETFKHLTD